MIGRMYFGLIDDVAERRLHAPQPEQNVAVDAVVLFDALTEARHIRFARSLPVMTRQSEQRRLMYCHISSVNSGCALNCA